MFYKGKFQPQNPQKYMGDPGNIVYRSSWELRVMKKLDTHPDVLAWGSEELVIHYKAPTDPINRKLRRYFTDFIVKMHDRDGKIAVRVLEVKPESQTVPPKPQKRKTKKYITEVARYGMNQAKWEAAEAYCKKRGWTFHLITEKTLFG